MEHDSCITASSASAIASLVSAFHMQKMTGGGDNQGEMVNREKPLLKKWNDPGNLFLISAVPGTGCSGGWLEG